MEKVECLFYFKKIKAKMESFASYKAGISGKNPNLISSALNTTSSPFLPLSSNSNKNEKFKSSFNYLISKSQSDNQLQLNHQQHQITTHHHHHQKQNHSMTLEIKNEHILPNFSKSNQAPLNESSLINTNPNSSSSIPTMPTLLPKPSSWSSHMYSFQSSSNENISNCNNSISKNTASNSQQLSYNQFL
jgi:hypothetical protein